MLVVDEFRRDDDVEQLQILDHFFVVAVDVDDDLQAVFFRKAHGLERRGLGVADEKILRLCDEVLVKVFDAKARAGRKRRGRQEASAAGRLVRKRHDEDAFRSFAAHQMGDVDVVALEVVDDEFADRAAAHAVIGAFAPQTRRRHNAGGDFAAALPTARKHVSVFVERGKVGQNDAEIEHGAAQSDDIKHSVFPPSEI